MHSRIFSLTPFATRISGALAQRCARRRVGALAFALLVSLFGAACGSSMASSGASSSARGETLEFSFAGIDGQALTSESTRGRVTVLLFVTTFDISSQAEAKRLEDLYRTHSPRLNAIAVILEAPRYVDLARSFQATLGLNYPIGMVDKRDLSEHPDLRHVQSVPVWIFLDAEGRVSSVAAGALSPKEAEQAAVKAQ